MCTHHNHSPTIRGWCWENPLQFTEILFPKAQPPSPRETPGARAVSLWSIKGPWRCMPNFTPSTWGVSHHRKGGSLHPQQILETFKIPGFPADLPSPVVWMRYFWGRFLSGLFWKWQGETQHPVALRSHDHNQAILGAHILRLTTFELKKLGWAACQSRTKWPSLLAFCLGYPFRLDTILLVTCWFWEPLNFQDPFHPFSTKLWRVYWFYCLTVSFTKTCHEKSQGPWHTIRQVRNHVASSTLHLWLWRWVVLDDHLKTPELRYMATGDSPGMPWLWISEKMLCKYDWNAW